MKRKMKRKNLFIILTLTLSFIACMPSAVVPTVNVDAIVQATFQALTAQASLNAAVENTSTPTATAPIGDIVNTPTFTPEGGLSGSIAGQLSYPSEFIPAQAVIAYHINGDTTDYYYYMFTNEGSGTYQLDNIPPGNYYVVAYLVGGGLSAGYSQAVPCGLSVACVDNSLIPVTVIGGQVTQGVNPQDWYAPEGSFPAYPLP